MDFSFKIESSKGAYIQMLETLSGSLSLVISVSGFLLSLALAAHGLKQYKNAQLWKKREFLSTEINKIKKVEQSRHALSLLAFCQDRLYPILPGSENDIEKWTLLSQEEIITAMIPQSSRKLRLDMNPAVRAAIQECFDDLFSRLEHIQLMIDQDLISIDDVRPYISWHMDRFNLDRWRRWDGVTSPYYRLYRNVTYWMYHFDYDKAIKLLSQFRVPKLSEAEVEALKSEIKQEIKDRNNPPPAA